ncbi:potassium channel subfamily K member 17-like [Diorhabda carinulata]|uniref:potassium channel subfamily K member 17-like n=1 Tax=Diorhabda carinulata TaxID=1163345 RepID=UPI0025A25289|nr:potassium channel subfamily K member 17-like [Diorhabda carinulata]
MLREPDNEAYSSYQNTFLRRSSPPGSPAIKKCCYDHGETKYAPPSESSFFCCCYSCTGSRSTSFLATLGVCCLVLGYTILGAFVFMALEGGLYQDTNRATNTKGSPMGGPDVVTELRSDTVDRLWSITENLNILYRENWTRLAAEEVLVFQEALFKVLHDSENGYVNSRVGTLTYFQKYHKWSFSSSFLYSLTLITTIGYGSVSPRTAWGKLVTIIYALIGIPLMLLYLSVTGDILARSFRRLYGKMCGVSPKKVQCPCSNTIRVPVTLSLVIVLAYICTGAVLFHRLENWSLLEGSYFCFTSLGTIGFGDLLPGQRAEEVSLCACSAYILTGMALVAMCFSLVQDEVMTLLRYIGAACTRNELRLKDEETS